MKHNRNDTPAYIIWVEKRPTMNGKGKRTYFDAIRIAAKNDIDLPIKTDDIEIDIMYATTQKKYERIDTDNVNKPTLDALKGIAYDDDRQVRSVTCTVFDKNVPSTVNGQVENIGPLFCSDEAHVVLIMIFSDTRLLELGGAQDVQHRRYVDWQEYFNKTFKHIKGDLA